MGTTIIVEEYENGKPKRFILIDSRWFSLGGGLVTEPVLKQRLNDKVKDALPVVNTKPSVDKGDSL